MDAMIYFSVFQAILETAALILGLFCMVKYLRKPRQNPPRGNEAPRSDESPQA